MNTFFRKHFLLKHLLFGVYEFFRASRTSCCVLALPSLFLSLVNCRAPLLSDPETNWRSLLIATVVSTKKEKKVNILHLNACWEICYPGKFCNSKRVLKDDLAAWQLVWAKRMTRRVQQLTSVDNWLPGVWQRSIH